MSQYYVARKRKETLNPMYPFISSWVLQMTDYMNSKNMALAMAQYYRDNDEDSNNCYYTVEVK
jgi:hypothetical protein